MTNPRRGGPEQSGPSAGTLLARKCLASLLAFTVAFSTALPALAQQGQGAMMRERFDSIDENGDGAIAVKEAAAWHDIVFVTMDADDNGALTFEEYMEVRMGAGAGKNPERQQARQEQKAARFPEMDANGDGTLSRQEFMAGGESHLMAADSDGDGQVSFEEFRDQHRKF
jgi:Ca2+-binding EF-hand superfamily protein